MYKGLKRRKIRAGLSYAALAPKQKPNECITIDFKIPESTHRDYLRRWAFKNATDKKYLGKESLLLKNYSDFNNIDKLHFHIAVCKVKFHIVECKIKSKDRVEFVYFLLNDLFDEIKRYYVVQQIDSDILNFVKKMTFKMWPISEAENWKQIGYELNKYD